MTEAFVPSFPGETAMRSATAALVAALVLAVPLPAAAQGGDSMTRDQIRRMLTTSLQLELLARACDFYMAPAQKVELARIRQAAADALKLTPEQVGSLRNELDDALTQNREGICLQDEPIYRQTLDALTQAPKQQ